MRAAAAIALGAMLLLPGLVPAGPVDPAGSAARVAGSPARAPLPSPYDAALEPSRARDPGVDAGAPAARILPGYYFPPPIDTPESGALGLLALCAGALGLARRRRV